VSPNAPLATRARELANTAAAGPLDRRAWGAAVVALGTTNTPTRTHLADWDGRPMRRQPDSNPFSAWRPTR